MKTRFLLAVAASFFIASILHAGGISKEKLLEMSAAKLAPESIANILNAQGIDFAVTPDSLLELARAGVDGQVLTALSKMAVPRSSHASSAYHAAADLYRAGKYAEATDLLESHLSTEPTDHLSRALLATTYLRLHKRDLASRELERLTAAGPHGTAAAAAGLLQNLLVAYDAQEALKEEFRSDLQNYRVTDALAVLDRMKLGDLQRQVLCAYIALYQADFDRAKKSLAVLKPKRYVEDRRRDELLNDVAHWEQSFLAASGEIDAILYGGVAPSTWWRQGGADQSPVFVVDYLKVVRRAAAMCPLNSRTMDLAFHSGLLTLDYSALEALGDSILQGKGTLSIPAYGRSSYLDFVIDGADRSLYSRVDTKHPFHVVGKIYAKAQAESEPFHLRFDEVTAIKQFADGSDDMFIRTLNIGARPYVLKFSPRGVVPVWSLANVVHYLYGAKVQKQATLNLGKFLLHVLGRPAIAADLADPTKGSGSGGLVIAAALAGAMSAAGAHYGNAGLQELGTQTLHDVQQASAQTAGARQATAERAQAWHTALGIQSMRLWEDDVYADVEKLLQLVN